MHEAVRTRSVLCKLEGGWEKEEDSEIDGGKRGKGRTNRWYKNGDPYIPAMYGVCLPYMGLSRTHLLWGVASFTLQYAVTDRPGKKSQSEEQRIGRTVYVMGETAVTISRESLFNLRKGGQCWMDLSWLSKRIVGWFFIYSGCEKYLYEHCIYRS